MNSPFVGMLTEHLEKFRAGDAAARLGAETAPDFAPSAFWGDWSIVGSGPASAGSRPGQPASGPGLLRMALSAAKSTAKFFGSGFKTVNPAAHDKRLKTCAR